MTDVVQDPKAITPVELRDGVWLKREDLFRMPNGVNGSKLRACFMLVQGAKAQGYDTVVSAASVISPQSAMAATMAKRSGMRSVTVVGGTTPEKAVKHTSIRIAQEQGSQVVAIPVGYNPALQAAGKRIAESLGAWQLPYGITTPADAPQAAVEAFLWGGSAQVCNIPDEVQTLVLPFGSGNSAAAVLYGLSRRQEGPSGIEEVVLMTIGPDRWDWLVQRLEDSGCSLADLPPIRRVHLHPAFATYGDRMPESWDGLALHPTYEGKILRFIKTAEPEWWRQDGTTMLWIVGGPL